MRKKQFTKLMSIVALVGCLVCAVLFSEFVSAGQFREPGEQDLIIQEEVPTPSVVPQIQEPVNEPSYSLEESQSFWTQTYTWDIALSATILVAALVFGVLFAIIQKLFFF